MGEEGEKVQVKAGGRYLRFTGEKLGSYNFGDPETFATKQVLYTSEHEGETRYRVHIIETTPHETTTSLDGEQEPLTEEEAREKYPALFEACGMPVTVDLDEEPPRSGT